MDWVDDDQNDRAVGVICVLDQFGESSLMFGDKLTPETLEMSRVHGEADPVLIQVQQLI